MATVVEDCRWPRHPDQQRRHRRAGIGGGQRHRRMASRAGRQPAGPRSGCREPRCRTSVAPRTRRSSTPARSPAIAGLPQRALYSASKGAILSLTLAMAADHRRRGNQGQCGQSRDRRHPVDRTAALGRGRSGGRAGRARGPATARTPGQPPTRSPQPSPISPRPPHRRPPEPPSPWTVGCPGSGSVRRLRARRPVLTAFHTGTACPTFHLPLPSIRRPRTRPPTVRSAPMRHRTTIAALAVGRRPRPGRLQQLQHRQPVRRQLGPGHLRRLGLRHVCSVFGAGSILSLVGVVSGEQRRGFFGRLGLIGLLGRRGRSGDRRRPTAQRLGLLDRVPGLRPTQGRCPRWDHLAAHRVRQRLAEADRERPDAADQGRPGPGAGPAGHGGGWSGPFGGRGEERSRGHRRHPPGHRQRLHGGQGGQQGLRHQCLRRLGHQARRQGHRRPVRGRADLDQRP